MDDSPRNQTAAVTGSTGAIGKAIAISLAELGYQVVLINRNQSKSEDTRNFIHHRTGNNKLEIQICDLSREKEIAALAANWDGTLDLLINNAAVTPQIRQETPEGIELQFATNILGYFWMTLAFHDLLVSSNAPRIVNVASYWAGGLDLDDLEFKERPYQNDAAYRQSKQANRMLTAVFAEKFKHNGITVNACHPGDVNSKLSNNLGFGGSQTPQQGADTPVWLAASPEVQNITGKYFENRTQTNCPFMAQTKDSRALYEICLKYTKLLRLS